MSPGNQATVRMARITIQSHSRYLPSLAQLSEALCDMNSSFDSHVSSALSTQWHQTNETRDGWVLQDQPNRCIKTACKAVHDSIFFMPDLHNVRAQGSFPTEICRLSSALEASGKSGSRQSLLWVQWYSLDTIHWGKIYSMFTVELDYRVRNTTKVFGRLSSHRHAIAKV